MDQLTGIRSIRSWRCRPAFSENPRHPNDAVTYRKRTQVVWISAIASLLLSAICMMSACRHHVAPRVDMTGLWAFRVVNGGTGYLELKQSGATINGTDIGFLRMPLHGSIKDNVFHVSGIFSHAGHSYEVIYDGTVGQQGITMTERKPTTINGGGEMVIQGNLVRTTRSEIYPKRLPLPALRNLADNGLVKVPPMGWNSWNKFHTTINDKIVREMADAMVASGMSRKGYRYILIDGGWEGARDAQGNLHGNARFPDMKALADYVHAKGLKIGIYSSPGPRTCGGYTGSYGHEEQDARTFAAWGFDYLKYDWCSAGRIYSAADRQAVYQKMGQALRDTGRPIVYSLSPGLPEIWQWAPKAGANLWRTTNDITDTWASIEKIGFSQAAIARYAGQGHWNDPDNLEVGNGSVTNKEARAQMSLWALLRAPLIAGNDLRTMSSGTKDILTNSDVIAIDQDPLALPLKQIVDESTSKVYLRKLSGNSIALGLFNIGDKPSQVSVLWSRLGLSTMIHKNGVKGVNVWTHAPVSLSGSGYSAVVPAHGVVLLRISLGS